MMTMSEFRSLFHNGLVKQNPGLVQLLGLCPLLAISNNVVNAVSLGVATTLVMAASSGAVSGVRHFVPNEIRIPVFVLIITLQAFIFMTLTIVYLDMAHAEHH